MELRIKAFITNVRKSKYLQYILSSPVGTSIIKIQIDKMAKHIFT